MAKKAKPNKREKFSVTFSGVAFEDTNFQFGDLNRTFELEATPHHEGHFRHETDEDGPYRGRATVLLKLGPPNRVTVILRSDITSMVPFDGYGDGFEIANTQIPSIGGSVTVVKDG